MTVRRPMVLAGVLATLVAACGSSPSSPSNTTTAQPVGCALTGGKVQVTIGYVRDRTKLSSPQLLSFPPSVVLVDLGDRSSFQNPGPPLARIDDYTWTTTVFMTPNSDPMSHGATVIDLAVLDTSTGSLNASAVTGVTANGVQVRKITFAGQDLGYFGVDACGQIFV